jgi:hypothetical protein
MYFRARAIAWFRATTIAAAVVTAAARGWAEPSEGDGAPAVDVGTVVHLTRDAVLNGVSLTKGTELRVVGVKKDDRGAAVRVDLEAQGADKKVFKGIAAEALAALTAAPTSAVSGDRASIFKVAAQIPIIRELVLGDTVFPRGSVLQVERVVKDKSGKVTKLDLRETSGPKRRLRDVPVDKLLLALSPDDVSWADAQVGRVIQLGAELAFAGSSYPRGTKMTVTRVETEARTGSAAKVDLRELEGQKREALGVPVALLKQNGAVGTAAGAPR